MSGKYIEASKGKMFILTKEGLQKDFVREMFRTYPMYKHKVPGKWILNKYVEEVEDTDG